MENNWEKLETFPFAVFVKPYGINRKHFIMIHTHGIWMYNHENNQWLLLEKVPTRFKLKSDIFTALHTNGNKRCLYMLQSDKLAITTLNNEKWNITQNHKQMDNQIGLIIDNQFNLIGTTAHLKWNENTKQFEIINEFNIDCCSCIVYLQNSSKILFFCAEFENNKIVEYDINTKQFKESTLKIEANIESNYCMIMNEQYIVFFLKSQILIYSVFDKLFKWSSISYPGNGEYVGVTVKDDDVDKMIISGYIREKCNRFKINILPKELLALICNWYNTEYIHLLECDTQYEEGSHWRINVSYLFDFA